MTKYLVYDVFTDTRFGGNQLAVFPDATGLPEAELQQIAAEFNFSEVTFVYPPADPAHTARVRIFTPTMEVPFAGHPVIGTATALADLGHGPDMVFELGIGALPCRADATGASFTISAPLDIVAQPDPALVARALGLSPDAITTVTHAPTMASLGLPFTITELTDRDALAAIQTDIGAFREGDAAYPSGLDFAQFAYVRHSEIVYARMFAPLDNIPEDPATGSACATLAALLTRHLGHNVTLTVHQGVEMGRPSRIELATTGPAITVSGKAVPVMAGQLL